MRSSISSTAPGRLALLLFRPITPYLPNLRNRQFFMADILSLSLTPLIALLLRVERPEAAYPFWAGILIYIAIAVPVRVTGFYWFGLYRRYWRYATVDD